MKRLCIAALLVCIICPLLFAQTPPREQDFRVFDGKGNPATLDQIVKAMGQADAVFLGEQHDDTIGHAVQLEIFKQAVAQYSPKRKIALSLEMFERDVQTILDEYLNGLISEEHFLLSSRPWANYKTDYRPLVELAREKRLSVVAANAPRRYVNMVSRGGRESLDGLSKAAKAWIAPLPYREPSEAYARKFKALMAARPEAQMGIEKILASQSLWDATMADSVARYLKKNKKSLVIHLNGGFHTESRLGTVEHLLKYRPKTKVLVVTIKYDDNFKTFDKTKHTDLGDFVILTAPKRAAGGHILSTILDRMDKHNQALKSLRAEVTVVEQNKQLGTSDTSSGSVNYLPRTGGRKAYVRIDWMKPVAEHIVAIGDDFELYRPRLDQVFFGKAANLKDDSFMGDVLSLTAMSKAQFKDTHDIKYMGEETLKDGVRSWRLEVTPRKASYKSAEMWIDVNGFPRQVKINKLNSDTTTMLLSNIQKNLTMNIDIFKLKYPGTVKKIKL